MFKIRLLKNTPLLLLLFATLLSGCAPGTNFGPLPAELNLKPVAKIAPETPVAWSSDGRQVALVRNGLRVINLHDHSEQLLDSQEPLVVSWDSNRNRLFAGFIEGENSLLRSYQLDRQNFTEIAVPGRIVWLDPAIGSKIYFATIVLKNYSFGSNYQQILFAWEQGKEPAPHSLVNTTIKPYTLKRLQEDIYRTALISIAPLKDEVLFARLHDPPLIDPFYKLVLMNLSTDNKQVLAELSLSSGGGLFFADGESVLFGDGSAHTKLVTPHSKKNMQSWPSPGQKLAFSPGGRYLFLDGQLFADGEKIAGFPAQSSAWFSPLGDSLLLAASDRLYLISGLTDLPTEHIDPNLFPQLLNLRRWRAEGLIDDAEYQSTRKRLLQQ